MKRLWLPAVVVAALLLGVAAGHTLGINAPTARGTWGFVDGNFLYRHDRTFQLGYVAGVRDAFSTLQREAEHMASAQSWPANWNPTQVRQYAYFSAVQKGIGATDVPPDVTLGQATDVVLRFLQQNPATRHQSAALLVWRAMAGVAWE